MKGGSWNKHIIGDKRFGHIFTSLFKKYFLIIISLFFSFSVFSKTYFSYQTGDWNSPSTWTSDPGGTTQIGTTVPGDGDVVVILTDRTVSLSSDISTVSLEINIHEGSFLNMSTFTFTDGLNELNGQGTLKLASTNFPSATTNTFVDIGGGTTEYNNTGDFTFPASQSTYNNLTVNASAVTATQLIDITLNGNLYVKQGTFRINDNTSTTKLKLIIGGDVTVDGGAAITTGNGTTNGTTIPTGITGGTAPYLNYYEEFHRVVINGDFTNNGTVRFTNLAYPVFDQFPPTGSGITSGAATVYFTGASDNMLTCNNTTDFYNLVIDKGTDQTYKLTVYSTAYSNFRLFGANISGGDSPGSNPNLKKALWIRTGTLVLKGLTIIPSLSEGSSTGTPQSDFIIPANGALVLDGSEVIVLSTSDDYGEVNTAYNVSGGIGLVNGVNTSGATNYQGLLVYGKLQLNNGYLSTRESAGLLYSNVVSGQIELKGGTIDAKQFREYGTTGSGTSFTQTGGTFILRGRFVRPVAYSAISDLLSVSGTLSSRSANGTSNSYGTFHINNTGNVYSMSGGTIRIFDACGTGSVYAVYINSSTANTSVTGGMYEFLPSAGSGLADAATHLIYNRAASFGNVIINRSGGCSTTIQLDTHPLTVLDDFTITSGTLTANNLDITIGGDFIVENGATYTPGTNTTSFIGSENQVFSINLTSALSINNLSINKTSDTLKLSGTQSSLIIPGNFDLTQGIFDDGGKTVSIAGDVTNSGTHTGTGVIQLNGTGTQTIGGDGNGIFENIALNNTNAAVAPVSLSANTKINGSLTFLQDKLFDINTNNLILTQSASIANSGANRYIQTSGNAGDGGLTIQYSTPATRTFPVGAPSTSHATSAYTPASIGFSAAPAILGSITVIPVGYEHPNTTISGQSLTYFWRVKSSGFTGIAANSVNHSFMYSENDVVGTEGNYIPSMYDNTSYSWINGTNVNPPIDITTNSFVDWANPGNSTNYLDGDYTAGDNAFGNLTIYYSRQTGRWDNTNTWSVIGHSGSAAASIPGINDVVIIGDSDSVYLYTENTNANTGIQNCASLQIEAGSALDIGYNPGCTFNIVQSHPNGNGNFRLTTSYSSGSTFSFPSGDFSDFNINLGTTEIYSTNTTAGTTYWLPNNITSYGNLIISPTGGSNIIFGNTDITVYGNCIIRGTNPRSWFLPTWNGNYPGGIARVSKTITINGYMDIQGGAFGWYGGNGGGAQDIVIHGDVIVSALGAIDVWRSNSSQSLSIGGSLINNTTGTKYDSWSYSRCDFDELPVTFFGNTSASVSSTGSTPYTKFSNVTINKGNSPETTLTCDIGGTLLFTSSNNWLTLQNGTFRYLTNTDLPISTSSTFTIPKSAGLYIDIPANVYIGNSNSNTNDLYLNGQLTLVNGNIYVGSSSAGAYNNDIEYSGSGSSELNVQGGNLIVNGQIRRNPSTTSGILVYNQSGGGVRINGNNSNSTNAKFEVLNSGSEFNMSAGTLTIVRGGGTSAYGDLYLRPGSSNVTGGEVIFSQGTINQVQNYSLDANIMLNDLTITGKTSGATRNATVSLLVSPLVLNGDLTLSNANSIFDANSTFDIDVTIKGDFNNNGLYNHYNNTTIFDASAENNGGAQSITGSSSTNFYDLEVSPVTSLTLSDNITINHDLKLISGQLICGNYQVNVNGDVENNATYTDTQYGILLIGTELQYLSGTGTFGRLEIDNSLGAELLNDITLQKDLVLTNGILNINQYLLTLGQNSDITGAPFNASKMITSDGVISNLGIRKYFGTPLSTTFTYPIGTNGNYTPVILTINANGNVGYIQVNNINAKHPTSLTPYRVLDYYWEVESSGISGFDGGMVFQYSPGDVLQVAGDESNYVASRLITPGISWNKAAPGSGTDNVDELSHTASFNFPAGTDNLSGYYTAGFDSDLPDDVPEYTSVADGVWSDSANWEQTGGTLYDCPPSGPNGFIVIIDHEINTGTDNSLFAYKTTINNKLTVTETTYNHNLGLVDGEGTLHLENGVLPAGDFTRFFGCSNNSILEYGGTGTYTLIADRLDILPNLYFIGTGSRIFPNNDIAVCKKLMIDGPTLDNSVNNKMLTILGTMERYNTGAFRSGSGSHAIVRFAGTTAQTIGGALGDFTGSNTFNHFEINNNKDLTINTGGQIEVSGNLLLTDGLITTASSNKLTITNTDIDCVIPEGGKSASYINGPLIKYINQGDEFVFPVGKDNNPGNRLTLFSVRTGTLPWTVEYFNPNTDTTYLSPLTSVNLEEYWTVDGVPTGSQAKINIKWDSYSDLTPLMTLNGLSDMRVAEHNGTNWVEIASTAMGDNYNGSVETSNLVTLLSGTRNFTVACINQTKPRARLSPLSAVCGNDGIPVTFTSSYPIELNYVLDYTKDGVPQTPITVTSLPYILPTDPAGGTYQLTGFSCDNLPSAGPIITGVVDASPVVVYVPPTPASAGSNQSLCGATSATLSGNVPISGSGLWTIVNGTGGTVVSPTVPSSTFNGTNGSSYSLVWTINNGGCNSSDTVNISYPLMPVRPDEFTSYMENVCSGTSNITYTVTNDLTNTSYNWSYIGTGVTINGNTNSVTLDFDGLATSGTLNVSGTNGCGTSSDLTLDITVNPLPDITPGANPEECSGVSIGSLNYSSAINNPDQYSIDYDVTAEAAGFLDISNAALPLSPIDVVIPGGAPVAIYDAILTVRNSSTGCVSSAYPIGVIIQPIPVTGPAYRKPNN